MAEEEGFESQIQIAMLSRVQHFRQQADSLTFEGVRRLLEEDMSLDKLALDVHKRFIKQLLLKYLKGDDEDNATNNLTEAEENISSTKEVMESPENHQAEEDVKETKSDNEQKMEDSPVLGLLTESKSTKSKMAEAEGIVKNEIPNESTILKAIRKRAAYFKDNSEEITMAGVRRLLEGDLKLDKYSLDPVKKLISDQLDEVLTSKISELASGVKQRSSQSKKSRNSSIGRSSLSIESDGDDLEDEAKPSKKASPKAHKFEGLNKRKRPAKKTMVSSKKQSKLAKVASEENSDTEDDRNDSEDGQSQSSAEKPVKKKEVSPPAYGKGVEHLKSIIKSCGMSVAPSVYKKAKQVPENKREKFLIKELEEILSREGLSRNPTEKEIKEVRKRKERAKELEGIDTSNIVLSSRRRSTTSFVPPPKPKVPVESDEGDSEDTDNDDDNEDEDSNDDRDANDVDDSDEGDDSQNEEVQEEDEDSD